MDGNNTPPPLPNRLSRPSQIQSIDNLTPQTTPNEYVEIHSSRPPKIPEKEKGSLKSETCKDIERQENKSNELREHNQANKSVQTQNESAPRIPPRLPKPPPLPPRDPRSFHRQPPQPVTVHQTLPSVQKIPQMVRRHTVTSSDNISAVQPAVVIFPENEHRHKSTKDLIRKAPVTQQPTASVTLTLGNEGTVNNTILCADCGYCRCSDCSGNRKLPERWLCEGNCRCSADSVVDALSCMWCVKSCFKTVLDNRDGEREHPCSCTESPKCLLRWTALAALSICMPCLCCYGPMRLGVKAATACYNCRKRGCRCEKD